MAQHFDLIERKTIQELLDHGTEIRDIAEILKRSQQCIRLEIKRNGGMRLYNGEEAQRLTVERWKKSNAGKNSPLQHLRKRVEVLEEQIKKLMENR
jgi:IS30 family transposase